jgi:hypothetical protein
MILNGKYLLEAAPIKNMLPTKERMFGVSHGLGEAGYDIRLKQTIEFRQRARDVHMGPARAVRLQHRDRAGLEGLLDP